MRSPTPSLGSVLGCTARDASTWIGGGPTEPAQASVCCPNPEGSPGAQQGLWIRDPTREDTVLPAGVPEEAGLEVRVREGGLLVSAELKREVRCVLNLGS